MNETLEICCPKMQKAVDKQWVKLYTFPNTNIIAFMIDSIVLIYCPFCGEYLPETSDIFTPLNKAFDPVTPTTKVRGIPRKKGVTGLTNSEMR